MTVFRLDFQARDEVSHVSAQETRCATGCRRCGSQPRAAGPQWSRSGSPRPTCAIGTESKVGLLGIVGHAWARAAALDCVADIDTSRLGSWIIGLFRQREGVACVAAAEPQSKVEKSGTVWRGLVPYRHRASVDKIKTIPLQSLKVWQFPKKEGGWCGRGRKMLRRGKLLAPCCTALIAVLISCASAQGVPEPPADQETSPFERAMKQFNASQAPEAVEKIKKMGSPAKRQLRRRAIAKTRSGFEREMAMTLLEKLEDVDATADLLTLLKDDAETAYLRSRAARSLHKIGRKHDKSALRDLKQRIGVEKNLAVRQGILMAIGRVGQKDAIAYLQTRLAENEPDRVTAGAIYGLGAIDDPAVIYILITGLSKDESSATMEFARVLSKRAKTSGRASRALLDKLDTLQAQSADEDPFLGAKKRVLFESLGEIQDPGAIPHLKQFITSSDFLDSFYAGMALGKLGDVDSLVVVIKRARSINEVGFSKRLERIYREATGREYSE